MQRRKFLATVGSLAAGSAAAIGTGAFTSVNAERGFSVNTNEDGTAYLGLATPNDSYDWAPTNDVGDYAKGTDPNTIHISLSGSGVLGGGVNEDALTNICGLIGVRNMGSQTRRVYLDRGDQYEDHDRVGFFGVDNNTKTGKQSHIKPENWMVGPDNGFVLDPGEVGVISVQVDTQADSESNSATLEMAGGDFNIPGARTGNNTMLLSVEVIAEEF